MFCQRSFKEKLSLFFRSELQEFCHGFTLQSVPHRAAAPQPRCPGRQTEPAQGPSTVPAIVPAADPYRLSAPLLLGLILKRWRITLKEGNETLPVISEGLFSSYQSPGAPKGGARPSAPVKTRRIRWGAEVTAGGDARHRAIIASSGGRRRFCIQRRNVSPIAPVVSDSSLSICRRVDSSSGSRGRPGNHPCWVPGSPGGRGLVQRRLCSFMNLLPYQVDQSSWSPGGGVEASLASAPHRFQTRSTSSAEQSFPQTQR